ncbi:SDR family oxidoreductase [Stenotrophomonas sp. LARHCG68]
MAILVTGSTGHTGREVVRLLAGRGAEVRALTRSPAAAGFPPGVAAVQGELADVAGMRAALAGISTLFLLAPNVGDELQQTLTVLNLAREAGVRGVVYLSVYQCELHPQVPHFACKVAAERMIEATGMAASILRPAFFMQNDLSLKDALEAGCYPHPVGHRGMAYVDTRDIAQVAADELLRREHAADALPLVRHDLVGPDNLTASDLCAGWGRALGRDIAYAGDDLVGFERELAGHVPAGFAHDLRMMFQGFQQQGSPATPQTVARMTALLGRPPRSHAAFSAEVAARWRPAN